MKLRLAHLPLGLALGLLIGHVVREGASGHATVFVAMACIALGLVLVIEGKGGR